MPRALTCSTALLAAIGAPLAGLELQQALTGEILIEYVDQNNYTDGNSKHYTLTDPTIYAPNQSFSVLGDQLWLNDANGVPRIPIDDRTWTTYVLAQDQRTYYNDRSSNMWMRAKLGAKVEIGSSVEGEIGLIFDAEGGDQTHNGDPGFTDGSVYVNDANVLLKRFILPELHLRAGRQAVAWNLRRDHGAFLYDSRANNPKVTSWDGIRGFYTFDEFTFSPYGFILDSARDTRGLQIVGDGTQAGVSNSKTNTLIGLQVDWQPEIFGDDRFFVTIGGSAERNAFVEEVEGLVGIEEQTADRVYSYYGGLEAEIGYGVTLYGEGAFQDGRFDDARKIKAHGYSVGADWELGGINNAVIGIKYDMHSGDREGATSSVEQLLDPDHPLAPIMGITDQQRLLLSELFPENPNNKRYNNFIAPWEGVSDTFIVEHERYGELSELLVGNMHGIKGKLEYRLDMIMKNRPIDLKMVYGYYLIDKPGYDVATQSAESNFFGQEIDLAATWHYNNHTQLSLFGGFFMPGLGYQQVAAKKYPNSRFIPQDERQILIYEDLVNDGQPSAVTTLINAQYPNITKDDQITLIGVNLQLMF